MLHQYYLRFLELEVGWIDALLNIGWNTKNNIGFCNLMFLFNSQVLDEFDF